VARLLQVRLVDAGEPVLIKTWVGRFLSSPQRVDVGMIGGQAGRYFGILRARRGITRRFLTRRHPRDLRRLAAISKINLRVIGRRLLSNGAVAGDQDIGVPGGLTQPVQCRLVGGHLIGAARVEERDQDVGEHVVGEQDATVREEDRGVADGVRLMLKKRRKRAG
jgi:hypothetical protein